MFPKMQSNSPPKNALSSKKFSIAVNLYPQSKDAESIIDSKNLLNSRLEVTNKLMRK